MYKLNFTYTSTSLGSSLISIRDEVEAVQVSQKAEEIFKGSVDSEGHYWILNFESKYGLTKIIALDTDNNTENYLLFCFVPVIEVYHGHAFVIILAYTNYNNVTSSR